MAKLVSPSKALGYSQLYLDLVAGDESARRFYLAPEGESTAQALTSSHHDRPLMAHILERQNQLLKKQIKGSDAFPSIIGESPVMEKMFALIEKIAGMEARPAAPQSKTATVVIAHLAFGGGEAPRRDINTRYDYENLPTRTIGPQTAVEQSTE